MKVQYQRRDGRIIEYDPIDMGDRLVDDQHPFSLAYHLARELEYKLVGIDGADPFEVGLGLLAMATSTLLEAMPRHEVARLLAQIASHEQQLPDRDKEQSRADVERIARKMAGYTE